MRRAIHTIVVFCLLLGARQAYADPVAVGDVLHVLGSDGNIWGGAFDVDNTSNGPGVDFKTFCVQMFEDIDYDNLFVVGAISDFADDDGGPDPLSLETAWIFSSYRHGALSAFTSDEIQSAIWMLEGDWTLANGIAVFGAAIIGDPEALIALAESNVNAGWVNDGVRVINLFTLDGQKAQDQLTLSEVPEPGNAVARWRRSGRSHQTPPRRDGLALDDNRYDSCLFRRGAEDRNAIREELGRHRRRGGRVDCGAGCATLGPLARIISPPQFEQAPGEQAEVRLLPPGSAGRLGGASVRIWTHITNPNPFGIRLSTLDGDLYLEGVRAANASFPLGLTLNARGDSVVPLDLRIDFSEVSALSGALRRALAGEAIPFRSRRHRQH